MTNILLLLIIIILPEAAAFAAEKADYDANLAAMGKVGGEDVTKMAGFRTGPGQTLFLFQKWRKSHKFATFCSILPHFAMNIYYGKLSAKH